MPKTITLTQSQLSATGCLASGMSYKETAGNVNVSIKTIQRWNAIAAFQEEVERRKQYAKELHQQVADEAIAEEVNAFSEALKEYRKTREQVYKSLLQRGLKGLQKVGRRFDDLPDEAIAPNTIAQLLNSFSGMTEQAMEGWAELIGVDEVLKRLEGDGTESGN